MMAPRILDVTNAVQLTLGLVPDLILMGGAMVLLVWAAWRRDSDCRSFGTDGVSMNP